MPARLSVKAEPWRASQPRAAAQAMHPDDAGAAIGSAHNYGASVGSNLVGPDGGQVLVDHTVKRIAELF